MHILFLTDNFPPEVNAPATRTMEHIMEWETYKDVKITVITCFPNYPQGKVYEGYSNSFYSREKWSDNVTLIRVWSYISPNRGIFKRIIDYFSFCVTSFIAGLFVSKPDVIIATSPQFFTTWSGFLLSKLRRAPWVFELRDIWPQSIRTVGASKSKILINTLERIELFLYHSADAVISVTDSFVENLVSRGVERKKIHVVKNGVNIKRFQPCDKNSDIIEKYNLSESRVVGYVGTIGMAHSLYFILKSITTLEGYKFMFIGDGAKREYLLKMKEKLGLRDVIFTGMVKKEKIRDYISVLDIALVNLKKSHDFREVIPSKIFELASMEKPILLGVEGEARHLVEKYNAGLCFEPENDKDFLEKLKKLSSDEKLYRKTSKNCRRLADDFDRSILAEKMFNILESITSAHKKN